MSARSPADVATRFIEDVWNETDGAERLTEWLHPAYRDHAYAGGKAGLLAALGELRAAFPDARFEIEGVIGQADTAALRLRFRGTHQGVFRGLEPTVRTVDVRVFRWFRVEDDRIVEHWALFDTSALLRQLQAG